MSRAAALALAAVAAAGCTSRRTVGQPDVDVVNQHIELPAFAKVDLLFMLDDSSSTTVGRRVVASFPELATRLVALASAGTPASLHIGVIDSDLGAGPYVIDACHPDGDHGELRKGANDAGVAPAACGSFSLPDGYIDLDVATGQNNLGGVDLVTALQCIGAVGDAGCGFEHPLEAIDRALTSPSLNPGFLRDDALLAVVLVTDEDDCSAPPDSPLFDPSSAGVAAYGPPSSFRCTRFAIACDGKPLDGGPLAASSDCSPVSNGPLFDVSRYHALFSEGGIKPRADQLVLMGIQAPPSPFAVQTTTPCAAAGGGSCAELEPSCVNPANPAIAAAPAVRIGAVLDGVPQSIAVSACESDYTETMHRLVSTIGDRLRGGCLPGGIIDLGDPGCVVTVSGVEVPRCLSGGAVPCWDVLPDMTCPERPTLTGSLERIRLVVQGAPGQPVAALCPLYEP